MLNNLEVELQTVTPLILHGVDPGGSPELRAPSLRGVMRYWFRAVVGVVIGDDNLSGLRQMEQAVFGQSEECASPISIRIRQEEFKTESAFVLPHKKMGIKKAIACGEIFTVKLSAYSNLHAGTWESAQAALLLMTTFGGLGQRSRRGYGTLRIIKCNPLGLFISPTSLDGWRSHFSNVTTFALNQVRILAEGLSIPIMGSSIHSTSANFPMATALGTIWLSDTHYHDPTSAVSALMQGIHTTLLNPDFRPSDFLGYSPMGQGARRQASPLWVRVLQTNSNPDTYQLLFCVLASRFDHNGEDYSKLDSLISKFPGANINLPGWNI